MQALNDCSLEGDGVYYTDVDWTLGDKNFITQAATAMDLARWPNNEDSDPFTQNSLRNSGGSPPETADFGRFSTGNSPKKVDKND